jgi:hypothetical protein
MTGAVRLAAFAAVLALVFAGAAAAGGVLDPSGAGDRVAAPVGHGDDSMTPHTSTPHDSPAARAEHPVRGLAVADDGLRVIVESPELRRGVRERVAFRVVDERGETVRDFDVEHERRMHLIVVRRDLTGFQHLHPTMDGDGTWTARVRLDSAGSYRLFADFARNGESHTLASDLRVDGPADLRDLPAPQPVAVSDGGYTVRLDSGDLAAGEESELRFTVSRDGEPVHTEPYLGAGGHLVALREGDLAFLHVHPTGHDEAHAAGAEEDVGFEATFPTTGRYRLFLQFKHDGRVHTAAFTQEVR